MPNGLSTEIRIGMSCMMKMPDGSEVPCRVVQKITPANEGDDPVFIVVAELPAMKHELRPVNE
jgi:hypothetical protein